MGSGCEVPAWRDIATDARPFYEAGVAPGDASARGVCGVAAGLRSDDVCVVAHVPLALLSCADAQAFDSDAVSDAGLDALDEVARAEDVPVDPVFLSFAAKCMLFEAPVPADDDDGEAERDHVIVSVSFMDGSAASFVFA